MKSVKTLKARWKAAGILAKVLTIVSVVFVMLFLGAPILPFSLNLTPSMPSGLYYTYECAPTKGDIIQFKPSENIWQVALDRGYVSARMEGMIKAVAASSGDKVCWQGGSIIINGEFIGEVTPVDSMGRPLGHVQECITVLEGQLLPMALDYHKSYDGRYFGLIPFENVQSCARPVWTF